MSLSDQLGIAGLVVGCVGVAVSGGSWIWAVRANRTAGRAEVEAHHAREAVESLAERFRREAEEKAELLVYRIGPGVNVINKSNHLLRAVALAPLETFDWNKLAEVGDLPALSAGAANVEDVHPEWSTAAEVFVYWLTDEHHRRGNVFPVTDADPAEIAAALGRFSSGPGR